ncbi:MAG: hypothetical protein M1321_00120 [Candidatus Marsarchaeota archaeon]|nr:hypothetical protein [Candidatus Marsarchaeota archaeon]
MPNINALKSQKANYAKALKHAIGKADLAVREAPNAYEKYNNVLAEADRISNDILAVNANFKTVMYCFSKHLSGIKRAFSALERRRESLRMELSRRAGPAMQYSRVTERILAINALLEESRSLREGAASLEKALESGKRSAVENEESKIQERISQGMSGLRSIDDQISRLSSGISLVTTPLERPSRKHDHLSVRKRQLQHMLADPVESIRTDSDYAEFTDMIKEMRASIEKNAIDIKNRESALNVIDKLLGSNLLDTITSLRLLRQKRTDMEREIRALEGALSELRRGKRSHEDTRREMDKMIERAAEADKSVEPAKQELESMFLEYYKRRISIII